MFQGFPGDFDSVSRGSSSPSIESQYFSSVDSFGSPPASASQVGPISQAMMSIGGEMELMCLFPPISDVDYYNIEETFHLTDVYIIMHEV